MTVQLTREKMDVLVHLCKEVSAAKQLSIRNFAVLIGKMVASAPGVEFAPIYYRGLEKEKSRQLTLHKGDFDAQMTSENKSDIQSWIDNVHSAFKFISHGAPKILLYTDSSLLGWGAFNETSGLRTRGLQWSAEEKD